MAAEASPYRYQVIKDYLTEKIRSGEYPAGAKIDSEPALCKHFGLARNTVRQAVKELEHAGYLYSVRGKGTFVRNATPDRSRKIALLIYDTSYTLNPVTANLIRGIDAGLRQRGYILDILAGRRGFHDERIPRLAETYAGFLIGAWQMDEPSLKELEKSGSPFLFVKNYLPSHEEKALRIDFERAGFLVAEHLIGRGCRDLGLFYAGETIFISRDFASGVRQACLEYGARLRKSHVVQCDYMAPFDPELLDPFMEEMPGGIVCPTDEFAIALCRELKKRGFRVPGDVRVTGCNNTVPAPRDLPSLTTIDIPTYELGLAAAEQLTAMIKREEKELPPPIQPALIEGESTGGGTACQI